MFARLVVLTEAMQIAARAAGVLPFRTVIRLTREEWDELMIDPVARMLRDNAATDNNYLTLNDVVIVVQSVNSHREPATPKNAPAFHSPVKPQMEATASDIAEMLNKPRG